MKRLMDDNTVLAAKRTKLALEAEITDENYVKKEVYDEAMKRNELMALKLEEQLCVNELLKSKIININLDIENVQDLIKLNLEYIKHIEPALKMHVE